MSEMFHNAQAFNGDLSAWDLSAVTNMDFMFYLAGSMNQDLGWCIAGKSATMAFSSTACAVADCGCLSSCR